jgi:hypothetical protein
MQALVDRSHKLQLEQIEARAAAATSAAQLKVAQAKEAECRQHLRVEQGKWRVMERELRDELERARRKGAADNEGRERRAEAAAPRGGGCAVM